MNAIDIFRKIHTARRLSPCERKRVLSVRLNQLAPTFFALGGPRKRLAKEFLRGNGIEIGALHHPLRVGREAHVTYVDRYSQEELVAYVWSDLWKASDQQQIIRDLVPVTRIDDGETLATFKDDSVDFVIGNHIIEHTENPIGTLMNWLRVLKPGGVLFVAVPDKQFTLDKERPVTPLCHVINDFERGPESSRFDHYKEFHRVCFGITGDELERVAKDSMENRESIHFHVWTQSEFLEMILYIRSMVNFDIDSTIRTGNEFIVIARKN